MEIYEAKEVTNELLEAFQRLIPQLSSSSQPPNRKELQDIINSQTIILFVAKDDGEVIGSLSLVFFRIPTGVRAWIEDVVVDESFRGRGIGKALIDAAIERALKLGINRIDLTSRPSRETANKLYQQVGFQLRQTNVYRYVHHDEMNRI